MGLRSQVSCLRYDRRPLGMALQAGRLLGCRGVIPHRAAVEKQLCLAKVLRLPFFCDRLGQVLGFVNRNSQLSACLQEVWRLRVDPYWVHNSDVLRKGGGGHVDDAWDAWKPWEFSEESARVIPRSIV